MKQRLCIFLVLASLALAASASIHLKGKVVNYSGGNVMLIQTSDTDMQNDTLQIAGDGSFEKEINLLKPGIAYLGIEEKKAFCQVFLEDDMKMEMNITESKVKKNSEDENHGVIFEYKGDNKDCFDYLQSHDIFDIVERWPFERLDTISFADYRRLWTADVEAYKVDVNRVKSLAFRRMMNEQLDYSISSELFRWVWSDNRSHALDRDFVAWVESTDHNDMENLEFCSSYLRWYGKAHPLGKEEKGGSFTILTKAFQNQEIINRFADDMILSILKGAPEDMDEELAAYRKVSTNMKGWEEADKVYAHYVKLKKGSLAADFTMTDKDGKVFSLKDFRGKALYIDCWATWCGPCCGEIPYMEKLHEHFKNSKDIELISISLDSNKKKWLQKLKEDKPKWRQFICPDNFKSQLCQNYDIDAIPRFLFFDKEGRIISLDAKRPSEQNIIRYIDENLK